MFGKSYKNIYKFVAVGYAGGCILIAAESEEEAKDFFSKYIENYSFFTPSFEYRGVIKGLVYENKEKEPCVIVDEVYIE